MQARAGIYRLFGLLVAWPLCAVGQATPKTDATASKPVSRPHTSAVSINARALEALRQRAQETKSDRILIWMDGRRIADWSYGGKQHGPIEAMSATKSIVSLVIGRLIDTGKIASLDTPVSDFYPEWKEGRHAKITLRHLLNHTSGLKADAITTEIYASKDFVRLALDADVQDEPGSRFFYNNKAVNLLAGIIAKASGQRMDKYIGAEIFAPLGITQFSWSLDPAGNPHAMSGLQIRAEDLLKIGQMLLQGGVWNGKQVVSRAWTAQSMQAAQPYAANCGLLWWLLPGERLVIDESVLQQWRKAKLPAAFIAKAAPLKDKVLSRTAFFQKLAQCYGGQKGVSTWYEATWKRNIQGFQSLAGPVIGYAAEGYLGQFLVVLPHEHLIAVRQRASSPAEDSEKMDPFGDFPTYVLGLRNEN